MGLELGDERALGIDRLDRYHVRRELGVALEIELGIGELGGVERLLGDRLVELRLVGDRIDVREHVAALHVLAFLEVDGEYLPVDLRANGDGIAGLGRAHPFEPDRHIGDVRLHGHDRDRAVCAVCAAPPAFVLLASRRRVYRGGGKRPDDKDGKYRFEKAFHLLGPVPSRSQDQAVQVGICAAPDPQTHGERKSRRGGAVFEGSPWPHPSAGGALKGGEQAAPAHRNANLKTNRRARIATAGDISRKRPARSLMPA